MICSDLFVFFSFLFLIFKKSVRSYLHFPRNFLENFTGNCIEFAFRSDVHKSPFYALFRALRHVIATIVCSRLPVLHLRVFCFRRETKTSQFSSVFDIFHVWTIQGIEYCVEVFFFPCIFGLDLLENVIEHTAFIFITRLCFMFFSFILIFKWN